MPDAHEKEADGRRARAVAQRKKMTPERSAMQSLSAMRSGARWQGRRGGVPPWAHALQGREPKKRSLHRLRRKGGRGERRLSVT